jgi:hypothetical protein
VFASAACRRSGATDAAYRRGLHPDASATLPATATAADPFVAVVQAFARPESRRSAWHGQFPHRRVPQRRVPDRPTRCCRFLGRYGFGRQFRSYPHSTFRHPVIKGEQSESEAFGAMLRISQTQLDLLTQEGFIRELRSFLLERTPDASFRAAMDSPASCYSLWRPLLGKLDTKSAYESAIRLSYALACEMRGGKPETALVLPEATMKAHMEAWGVLRFSEFDL